MNDLPRIERWMSKKESDLLQELQKEHIKKWLEANKEWVIKTLENMSKTLNENENN